MFFRRPRLSGSLVFTLAALAFAPVGCDSNPEVNGGTGGSNPCVGDSCEVPDGSCEKDTDCATGQFCTSKKECGASCATCGASCDSTSNCPAGQFCTPSKTCQQECDPAAATDTCGTTAAGIDLVCSQSGVCVEDSEELPPTFGGSSGTGGSGTSMGGGDGCIDFEVEFDPVIPNVVLLLDQSLSMTDEGGFGDRVDQDIASGDYVPWACPEDPTPRNPSDPDKTYPNWRWNVVRSVLFNPDTGIVKPLEGSVRFGMTLYSYKAGTDAMCPGLTSVDLAMDNYDEMLAAMPCHELKQETPTRESLHATAAALAALPEDGPKIIVLATDGVPDNCTCNNWDGNVPDACKDEPENQVDRGGVMMSPEMAERYDVVQEAAATYADLGITVHVIDVSTPTNTTLRDHLTEVATAGNGDIFDGTRPTGLVTAFETIINGSRSCVVKLKGKIAEGHEEDGEVTLDGEEVPLVTSDTAETGWKVNAEDEIELVGEACEAIKTGEHDIQIHFPCDAFIPPIK